MRKTANRMRFIGMLASGCMLLQFGGCSLNGFIQQATIGFARGFGAIPSQVLFDLTIGPLLDDLVGGNGE
jgi:hypothetical protein